MHCCSLTLNSAPSETLAKISHWPRAPLRKVRSNRVKASKKWAWRWGSIVELFLTLDDECFGMVAACFGQFIPAQHTSQFLNPLVLAEFFDEGSGAGLCGFLEDAQM